MPHRDLMIAYGILPMAVTGAIEAAAYRARPVPEHAGEAVRAFGRTCCSGIGDPPLIEQGPGIAEYQDWMGR